MHFPLRARLRFGLRLSQWPHVAGGVHGRHSSSEQSQKWFILYWRKRGRSPDFSCVAFVHHKIYVRTSDGIRPLFLHAHSDSLSTLIVFNSICHWVLWTLSQPLHAQLWPFLFSLWTITPPCSRSLPFLPCVLGIPVEPLKSFSSMWLWYIHKQVKLRDSIGSSGRWKGREGFIWAKKSIPESQTNKNCYLFTVKWDNLLLL